MNRVMTGLALMLLLFPAANHAQALSGQSPGLKPLFANEFLPDPMGGAGGGQVEYSATRGAAFTRLMTSATVSTLGAGVAVGSNLGPRLDARLFGNFLYLTHNYSHSGFQISLNLDMPNAGAKVDFYPFQRLPLRVSPGFLFLNQNRVRADIHALPGAVFTINHIDWHSDTADPVHGTGRLLLGGTGFTVTTGLGHLVSHTHKRFTYPFEAGVVFINKPRVIFNLLGSICKANQTQCQPAATYPTFEANLAAQVATWNRQVAPFHIYPIVEGGVAYSFSFRGQRF